MTYVERDIHGSGECSPAVLRAAIVDRGKKLAGRYAPGRIYREPPVGVEDIIVAECKRFPGFEVDPDGVTVQVNEETAGMQSKFWVERANPGGIGAVDNNPDLAIDFTKDAEGNQLSFEEGARRGIRAHVAKLRNYRFGEGPWSVEDPRAPAIRANDWMGTCRTWGDLQGKWATSETYAESIESIWTRMAVIRREIGGDMAGDDNRFQWVEERAGEIGYPQGTHGRRQLRRDLPDYGVTFDVDLLVLHITIGNDSLDYLLGKAENSAHYLTWKNGTPRAQTVRDADAAWAAGHYLYNLRGLQVEQEKRLVTDPWTDEMYRNLAETCYGIAKRHNIPLAYLGRDHGPGKRGFIGHSDVPDPDGTGWGGAGNHTDPGANFDWPRFMTLVRALDGVHPPVIPADTVLTFVETGQSVGGGFRAFWETFGGVPIFGFPLTGEFVDGGMTVQYFERAVFEWHPVDGDPARWHVMLRRLGADALAAQEAA